jgi:hypothetical protein
MSKNLTSLKALTRFLAVGDSTSTSFGDTDILIALNGRYQDAFLLATQNDGDFEFNGDGSQSISITSGARAYSLATDLFKVNRVEIKYPSSSTDYQEARQIKGGQIQQVGKDNYVSSRPEFDILGEKIEIYVSAKTADISAVTSGIKVYYQKELTELAVAGDEIIFPDVFARYICIGSAIDYCGVNGLSTRLSWLLSEYQKQEAKLTEYVATRNQAKRFALKTSKEDYGAGRGHYGISDKSVY